MGQEIWNEQAGSPFSPFLRRRKNSQPLKVVARDTGKFRVQADRVTLQRVFR